MNVVGQTAAVTMNLVSTDLNIKYVLYKADKELIK